ncbi:MAG: hypothetical protein EAZ57_04635 [Cytophagales bacterium]|nr:MAG: hypothetical protein EAZ67_01245 [Cytophagales bacterium]TAF61080.1 MAG: hypothetical protein EAZ57_04635 [Cytophagales bacterium]
MSIFFRIACLFSLIALSSCGWFSGRIINTLEPVNAPDGWGADDVKIFEMEVEDTLTKYNIGVNLHHNNKHQTFAVSMKLMVVSPNRVIQELPLNLSLLDSAGKYQGESGTDFYELSYLVAERLRLTEMGIYTLELVANTNHEGVQKIGVWVEKAPLKK